MTFTDVEINDILVLLQPPYVPMVVIGKTDKVVLTRYPPRSHQPHKTMTASAFDAAGYVAYEESV